jgi:tetratricopeptide (TPR) repeat protein
LKAGGAGYDTGWTAEKIIKHLMGLMSTSVKGTLEEADERASGGAGDMMNDDQQHIQNTASNQGAQGIFHGVVTFDQRTTVYAWARATPADPQTVEAAHALLDQLPTDAIPNPAPALPPGSRVPNRVATFVGRTPDLYTITAALKDGQTAAINQAASVHGLGGVGKTSVAAEFVYRYGAYFAGGVFWLSFADPANIPVEIAQCGGEGGLQLRPDFHELPLAEQVAAVQRAWAEEIPRLLVFDNVDSDDGEALVQQYRPTTGGCRVLITSRRGVWDTALGITALPLGVLLRQESIALLGQFRTDLADADADAIATELGNLPLALHLAGSFLKKYVTTSQGDPAAFLARLRDPRLLEHPALQGRATGAAWSYHERSVARTFALSYERLDENDEVDALALALLARAAHFAPGEAIPRELLLATVATEDELLAVDALERLTALGLLEDDTQAEPTLHRLLGAFVREVAQDGEAQAAVEQVMLTIIADLNTKGIPAPLLTLQSHLRHITDAAMARTDERSARLCNESGYHLKLIGDYSGARLYVGRALAVREQVPGPQHPDTAISLNNLGSLLIDLGDLAAARPYLERALAISEQVLGPQHPLTAQSLNNLGMLLQEMGDLTGARRYLERALAIFEQVLGPQHLDTAQSLNNLGYLLDNMGNRSGARPLYERALAIREQALGLQHPDTARSLNNLGLLLREMGDLAAARPLYERALAIREQALGPTHPDTAQSLNNLGYLLQAQGDLAGARPYYERALAIREQALGPTHPDTAQSLNNLGYLLHDQGDLAAARPLYERALAITEQVLGPDHPHTRTVRRNLATLAAALKRDEETM